MYQKYVNAMPLYRQEKDWQQHGIKLSRATLANWVIRCSHDWLMPITAALRLELLKREILHADETTLQVLNEPGKKAQTKSYMWLYRTGNDGKPSNGEIGRDYCNRLFEIEKQLADLTPIERKKARLELEKPVLEAFWSWINSLQPLKESRLGKAVTYANNQKKYLETYLLDGRCSLSNNLAENSIRPFTVGRKNWEFSASTKGADASATVYSLVETAKANGLNIYSYLQYLLLYMTDVDYKNHPEDLETLMPWSKEIQEHCK